MVQVASVTTSTPSLEHAQVSELRINMPSGNRKKDGWLNVDIEPKCEPDLLMDITRPLPWPDNAVSEIWCSHFVEHLGDEFVPFMDECYRVLKPGGKATFLCPYYNTYGAWRDPTHKRGICESTFSYFNADFRKEGLLEHYPIKADFLIESVIYGLDPEFERIPEERLHYMIKHLCNIVNELQVTLIKAPGQKIRI